MKNYGENNKKLWGNFYRRFGKRLLDIFISILGLFLLAPLFLILIFIIKLDSRGNAFFQQERLGKKGRIFKIYKFRTMVVGAEQMGAGIFVENAEDKRITRTGLVLRSTSLDELPQLYNILKGDMSAVGPRPPAVYHPYDGYENYPEWSKARFNIRPGITGLAQVKYRNEVNWEERIKLDVEYVKRMNFRLDCLLILQTAMRILKRRNIY